MKQVKQTVHYWCSDIVKHGWLGQGITIAVLDTGIALHPDFDRRILAFQDIVHGKKGIYDDSGHGTHVAGIAAGSGRSSGGIYAGMAPRAGIIALKVLDHEGNGSISDVMRGIQWILDNRKKYGIRIVNISVGARHTIEESSEQILIGSVEELWDKGLVVVASSGNYGPGTGSVAIPGASKKIITVGASDDDTPVYMKGSLKTNYSGCGPTEECVIKPDVVAPGSQIKSCNSRFGGRRNNPYTIKSGTSMATPVVAGAIADLLSKYPDMGNVEVKLRLRSTCRKIHKSRAQGWGLIDMEQLLK